MRDKASSSQLAQLHLSQQTLRAVCGRRTPWSCCSYTEAVSTQGPATGSHLLSSELHDFPVVRTKTSPKVQKEKWRHRAGKYQGWDPMCATATPFPAASHWPGPAPFDLPAQQSGLGGLSGMNKGRVMGSGSGMQERSSRWLAQPEECASDTQPSGPTAVVSHSRKPYQSSPPFTCKADAFMAPRTP